MKFIGLIISLRSFCPAAALGTKYLSVNQRLGTRSSFLLMFLMSIGMAAFAQNNRQAKGLMEIGVASVDITPDGPIRLTGFAAREKTESRGVIHRLHAKAMAFGSDVQGPSILITVDLVGIQGHMTRRLADRLSAKAGIDPARFAICSSHTHGGPEVGLLNILQARGNTFNDSLLSLSQLIRISAYQHQLEEKLERVAFAALNDRKPRLLSWGQGQAGFAKNRRTEGGPVDHALPLLKVADADGKLRALLVNYACHGTTLPGSVNEIHGDWIGEAQKIIEQNHPGIMAMIAIGCGADSNPFPRGEMEHMRSHAQSISDNVDKLLSATLQPVTSAPTARMKWVKLPFAHVPDVPELIEQTEDKTVKGYYARLALERVARGQDLPREVNYPIQVWTFGNELVMVNLAGEVVVDYSLRLKKELGEGKLWINAYTNDVPCYIASRRVIGEGGYEAESSMYWYDKPSAFAPEVEDIIISGVHALMPTSFKRK